MVDLYQSFSSPVPIAAIDVLRWRDRDFVRCTSAGGAVGLASTNLRPYLWPIKVIMCVGFVLMLLQAFAEFFKDLARIRGVQLQ